MAFKEIVTKAVIGKAKKSSSNNYSLTPQEKPDTVLGCWVINHNFLGEKKDNKVKVNGSFDVNVWYSCENDSKTSVAKESFSYTDLMNVPLKDDTKLNDNSEIIVRCLRQPTVSDVKIDNGVINMKVDKELGVEIVGDAKVKINVEEDYDDYEEIYDDTIDLQIDEINEDYLEKSDS